MAAPGLELATGGSVLVLLTKSRAAENLEVVDRRAIRYKMQSAAKYILPNHRVGICTRNQIEQYGNVDVWKHRKTQRAFYGGLMACGSVWVCPICAARISEKRQKEVRKAMIMHTAQGGVVGMMTLTFAHSRADKLSEILKKMYDALDHMRRQRAYRVIAKRLGLIGTIRVTEVTYGENGWHPHLHILMLMGSLDPWEYETYQEQLFRIWRDALQKLGLTATEDYGLKFEGAEHADGYVTKWGAEHELTKAVQKKGKKSSLTPFDLLRALAVDGDTEYIPKFREYARSMQGKRQLVWSRGIKQRFEIEDKSDEQLAIEKEEPADLIGRLDWKKWRMVARREYRAEFLKICEEKGFDSAIRWIDDLAESS